MKKIFSALMLLALFVTTQAQKEKIKLAYNKKTGIVSTETEPVFKVLEEKSAQLPTAKNYTIQNLEGKNLFILACNVFEDARERSQSNPSGEVIYYEVTFLNEKKDKVEIAYNTFMNIMKVIYHSDLIKDGKLNPEAVELFVIKNGNKFGVQRDNAR